MDLIGYISIRNGNKKMKFERFVKELIQGGWSLIGDSEGGISFLNTESEIEVEMENTKKESHVYLRFSHGLRMKDLSDLVEVGFTNTSTILKFADGEIWEYEDDCDDEELPFDEESFFNSSDDSKREKELDECDMKKGISRSLRS